MLGNIDEGEQYRAHLAHDFVGLVEPDLVCFGPDDDLLLPLVFVDLNLFEDVDGVFLLLGSQEHPAGDDGIQQIFEVFFRLGGLLEKVLFELLVVFVNVLLINLHTRKS